MTQPTNTIPFDGLDPMDGGGHMPDWYRTHAANWSTTTTLPFMEAIRPPRRGGHLPDARTIPAGYYDDDADEWREAGHYVALVNPAWLGDGIQYAPDGRDDAVWHIPTVGYDLVNPVEAYGPLVAAIRKAGLGNVYGQLRVYGHGEEAHLDLFIDDLRVQVGGVSFTLGLSSGYDFKGGTAHYARVTALNHTHGYAMRHLAAARKRRANKTRQAGVGGQTAADIAEWWFTEIDRLEAATDTMLAVVADAMDYVVPAGNGFAPGGFYEAQGLPEYLAHGDNEHMGAAERVARSPRGRQHGWTAWRLYRAAAETMAVEYDGKDATSTLRRHLTAVNRILFEPAVAESRALKHAAQTVKQHGSPTASGATAQSQTAQLFEAIQARHESLADAREQTQTMRARLRKILDAAEEEADENETDGEEVTA